MDPIDIGVVSIAAVYVGYLIVQLGTECASKVWLRTLADLDELDLIEAAHVPNASSLETLVIFFAVMLRTLVKTPADLVKEVHKRPWEKTAEMRELDREMTLRRDILGSVSLMLSGYPERARPVFEKERVTRIAQAMDAHFLDHQSLNGRELQELA